MIKTFGAITKWETEARAAVRVKRWICLIRVCGVQIDAQALQ